MRTLLMLLLAATPLAAQQPDSTQSQKLEKARADYTADVANADNIIWYGRRLGYVWRYRDAIAVFSEGIAKHPGDARMYRHRGHRYITVREFDNAIADLEKAAALVQGKPDEVEPDGAPNKFNIPVGTLHHNIYYHLALAHYLKHDFARALPVWQKTLAISTNDDAIVSAADWLYMTLRRMDRKAEAAQVLAPIRKDMKILENTAYHQRLLLYKGEVPAESLLGENADAVQLATYGYGVANWYFYNGDGAKARELFERIVNGPGWAAFGFIAAEAELRGPERAEIFAPGVISDARWQWRLTFTPDGKTAYFTASDGFFPQTRRGTIMVSHQQNGTWSTPGVASFSGTHSDIDPFITPDGERMYFSSIRPRDGKPVQDLDMFVMKRTASGWSEPERLGAPFNSPQDELYPSQSAAGVLCYASGPLGPTPDADWNIYCDGKPLPAINTDLPFDATAPFADWEFNPEISADGRTLIFTSQRPGGFGYGDLYISRFVNGAWSAPRNLGPNINTADDEFHPTLSRDGRTLYFARTRFGAQITPSNFYSIPFEQSAANRYRAANEAAILNEYAKFVAIPNLASDSVNIRANARYIVDAFAKVGVTLTLWQRPGAPPLVYGELRAPGATRTIGLYAHYDGQPVDLAAWRNPPWQPTLFTRAFEAGGEAIPFPKDGERVDPEWRIYARSASDDKAPIQALLAVLRAGVKPTVNLKFMFDGEEEVGSPNLEKYVADHRAQLNDIEGWLFLDGPVHQSRDPLISFGARGITGLDITVYGAARGLHSGHYGNWAPNPALMLAQLVAKMKDEDGRVLIPGFYDSTEPIGADERAALNSLPDFDASLKRELGLADTDGGGRKLAEVLLQPSLNIRGFNSGNTGAQASNVIPPTAAASMDIRLVKGNDPEKMLDLVEAFVRQQGYHIVRADPDMATRLAHPKIAKIVRGVGTRAAQTAMDLPFARDVLAAARSVSGERMIVFPTMGGTLPLFIFTDILKQPAVVMPMVNHDNNQHASNENLRIANLWYGIELLEALVTMRH